MANQIRRLINPIRAVAEMPVQFTHFNDIFDIVPHQKSSYGVAV
jgi:hypothetical protein